MMNNTDWQALQAPFQPDEIEWRIQQSGLKNGKPWAQALAYVQARAIQDRLDFVCTPARWRNEFKEAPQGGILCGISIKVNDEWITKWDGAENTDIAAVKGGLSGATKRAAVQWGIGRYLYKLETQFVNVTESRGQHYIGIKEKKEDKFPSFKGYWDDPKLPEWALPSTRNRTVNNVAKVQNTDVATDRQKGLVNVMMEKAGIPPAKRQAWLIDHGIAVPLTVDGASNAIEQLKQPSAVQGGNNEQ